MNKNEQKMIENNYVKSPNNLFGTKGSFWYSAGPGTLDTKEPGQEILVDDKFHISNFFKKGIIEITFDTFEELQTWLNKHGAISQGGINYGYE